MCQIRRQQKLFLAKNVFIIQTTKLCHILLQNTAALGNIKMISNVIYKTSISDYDYRREMDVTI